MAFMRLTFCAHDEAMYRFLQEYFSEEELTDYWKKELSGCVPGTLGSNRFFNEYFNMTDDLMRLTKICTGKYTPEEFAKVLASSRVFEREKKETIEKTDVTYRHTTITPPLPIPQSGSGLALVGTLGANRTRDLPLRRRVKPVLRCTHRCPFIPPSPLSHKGFGASLVLSRT